MNRKIALLLISLFITSLVHAAGYIKFDGIEGESRDSEHKGWIDLQSVSMGVSRDAASGMATGKRQHKPLTITKEIDKSSPMLMRAKDNGTVFSNVKIKADGHVTVLKRATIVDITSDGNAEVITLEGEVARPATDYNSSRSNNLKAVETLDTSPANHNTTRSK
jgi:type VI protein secretion system component Hcp